MLSSAVMSKRKFAWTRATVNNKCPSCGHTSWCMWRPSTKADETYVICMRKASTNGRITYIDGKPAYHSLIKGAFYSSIEDFRDSDSSLASSRARDVAYRVLLDGFLRPHHKSYLLARNVTEGSIKRNLYTSMPNVNEHKFITKKIMQVIGLEGIPGFYKKNDEWKIKYLNGILLPVINSDGLITGCQINTEAAILSYMLFANKGVSTPEASKPYSKYIWFSSNSEGKDGVGAEAGPHFSGVSSGGLLANLSSLEEVNIVEGILKADLVNQITGLLTIGQPGVGIGTNAVIQYIMSNSKTKINIGYDGDWAKNDSVKGALVYLISKLKEFRNNLDDIVIMTWSEDAGNGLDDVLLGNRKDSIKYIPALEWINKHGIKEDK